MDNGSSRPQSRLYVCVQITFQPKNESFYHVKHMALLSTLPSPPHTHTAIPITTAVIFFCQQVFKFSLTISTRHSTTATARVYRPVLRGTLYSIPDYYESLVLRVPRYLRNSIIAVGSRSDPVSTYFICVWSLIASVSASHTRLLFSCHCCYARITRVR